MATSPSSGPNHPAAPNWFARSWTWAVPFGLLVLGLVFAVFVGSIFLLLGTSFRHSEFYTGALARARAKPQVSEKIRQPLQEGWLASGSVNTSGPSGDADLSIPINGPKGKGTLYLGAEKSAGLWKI
jgi:Cytochrome oxidase complex assembly protein 1